jgi:hypothetical protein
MSPRIAFFSSVERTRLYVTLDPSGVRIGVCPPGVQGDVGVLELRTGVPGRRGVEPLIPGLPPSGLAGLSGVYSISRWRRSRLLGLAAVLPMDSTELAGETLADDDSVAAVDRPEVDEVDERLDDAVETKECERACRVPVREDVDGGGCDKNAGRGVAGGDVTTDVMEGEVTMTAGVAEALTGVVDMEETSDFEGLWA